MIKFSRDWAMPSKWTFGIKPIAQMIARYRSEVRGPWIDPFAGQLSPAEITNDLRPDAKATFHLDAREFAALPHEFYGILFDPPYSPRQISECYKGLGRNVGMTDTQHPALISEVKNKLAAQAKPGCVALSFGWNSGGFGKGRGFELIEIKLIAHGGSHNDTICTVEVKTGDYSPNRDNDSAAE